MKKELVAFSLCLSLLITTLTFAMEMDTNTLSQKDEASLF